MYQLQSIDILEEDILFNEEKKLRNPLKEEFHRKKSSIMLLVLANGKMHPYFGI